MQKKDPIMYNIVNKLNHHPLTNVSVFLLMSHFNVDLSSDSNVRSLLLTTKNGMKYKQIFINEVQKMWKYNFFSKKQYKVILQIVQW